MAENNFDSKKTVHTKGNNRQAGAGKEQTGKTANHKSGAHSYKPQNTKKYVAASLLGNLIFGAMGIGIGFLFFLAEVIFTGSVGFNILIFVCSAIIIVIYLYIILMANKWLVKKCSDKKSKRTDKNRLFWSMLYVSCIMMVSFAYSFLRAAISANFID